MHRGQNFSLLKILPPCVDTISTQLSLLCSAVWSPQNKSTLCILHVLRMVTPLPPPSNDFFLIGQDSWKSPSWLPTPLGRLVHRLSILLSLHHLVHNTVFPIMNPKIKLANLFLAPISYQCLILIYKQTKTPDQLLFEPKCKT